jgi:N-acetyl sugar amidotransferase
MRYCKRCIATDTRPNVIFDEEGICGGCRYEEERQKVNWEEREKALLEIVKWAKENTTCSYDCVIGVSGGKDSHFQALYAKEKLGLNPLLVCNAPDGRTEVGTHNIENLRSYGFDLIEIRPDPEVMRALTKRDFIKYGNLVKSSEYSLWSSAYRVAVEKKIPLVIQGENPALVFGLAEGVNGGDALTIKHNNTIKGCNADDLVISKDDAKFYQCIEVPRNKLDMFEFPSDDEFYIFKNGENGNSVLDYFDSEKIKGVFLQYYAKEWSQVRNAEFAVARGLLGRYTEKLEDIGRYRRETSVDGDHLLVNQYLKYLKFGFGFANDQANYDIREGRITREEGIELCKRYDGKIHPRYIKAFCDYIGISASEFYMVVERHVNKKLFYFNSATGEWTPLFKVGEDYV